MLPRPFRRRGEPADPGQRAGGLPPEGKAGPALGRWAVHPVLIAAFPVVSLYAHNLRETRPGEVVGPLAATTAGAAAAWLVLRLLSGDGRRAALATSLLVALTFGFAGARSVMGDALTRLHDLWVPRRVEVLPWAALATLAVLAAPILYATFRRRWDPGRWTAALNVFSAVLVAMPTATIVEARLREPPRPVIRAEGGVPLAPTGRRPDIYYIVLDAYGRSDVLGEVYGLDNRPFLDHLRRAGFFVADASTSNYCQTRLSIASSLNFNYLDRLIDPASRDVTPLDGLIRDNLVVRSLRAIGYKFVAFSSGYDPTDCRGADVYIGPGQQQLNFRTMLLGMTPLPALNPPGPELLYSARRLVLYTLDHLPDVTEIAGPKFVFAHMVCPHPPFVFGEDGEDVGPRPIDGSGVIPPHRPPNTPESYREGYRRQASYMTRRIEGVIDAILARSPEPPIIILQSDHGPGLRHDLNDLEKTDLHERMSILNCYYFPDRDYSGLDARITPVDSFRVVLDHVFGARLPILEGRNLFSPYKDPLALTDVTERVRSGRDRGATFPYPTFYPHMD